MEDADELEIPSTVVFHEEIENIEKILPTK